MDESITFGVQLFCLLPVIIFAAIKKIKINSTYILLSIAYIFASFALLNFISGKPLSAMTGWNWFGKSSAIAFSLIIVMALPTLRAEFGFTFTQKSNSIAKSLAAIAILFLVGAGLSFTQDIAPFNIETILFQLTMPSLDEEIAYRGILLYFLSKAFSSSNNSRLNLAVILIIVLFGAAHGIHYVNGNLNIDPWAFFVTASVGAILMHIRLLSGSIVFPILGHSVFNVTLLSGAMIQYHG